jgi:hypothetical protein
LASSTGKLRRAFIWGSFVTSKVAPNDVDILLIMDESFEVDGIAAAAKAVFDSARANCRSNRTCFGPELPLAKKCSTSG